MLQKPNSFLIKFPYVRKDVPAGSAEARCGGMRNVIDSGNYKRPGMSAVECGRDKARELGKGQIMRFS